MSLITSLTHLGLKESLQWWEISHLLDVAAMDTQEAIDIHDKDLELGIIPKRFWPFEAPAEAAQGD